jgi:hypothetical protein
LIFSTKNREKRISEELPTKLWPYMAGIASNHGFEAINIGGIEDHALAIAFGADHPSAKAVQIWKACSSKWINDQKPRAGTSRGRKGMALSV